MLTEDDVEAISLAVVSKLPSCSLGFDSEDAAIIKNHLGVWKKARNIIGTTILIAISTFILAVLSKGTWTTITDWLRIKP